MAKPIRIVYSIRPRPTWVRAVMRMPMIAITSMPRITTVSMARFGTIAVVVEPKTASTDGPRTTVVLTVPMMPPMIISQPVRKPTYGLITRPTHSKAAPQLAFHRFRRR